MSTRLNDAVRTFVRKDAALTIMGMPEILAGVEAALRDYKKAILLWQNYQAVRPGEHR